MTNHINITLTIPAELGGQRLDQALAHCLPEYSRARIQSWIKKHQVSVNGEILAAKTKINGEENVTINAQQDQETADLAQAIALDILFEDEHLLVLNKPIGLVVHPGAGNPDQTLVNALLHHAPQNSELPRAGIIHRLDKNTSGIMVIAKTLNTHTALVRMLQERHIARHYEAVANGNFIAGGTVDAPIGRHRTQRTKMAIDERGKPARTHYRIIEKFRVHTHLALQLDTGRTHQIRVHMASIQHPLVGDGTYGGRVILPKGADEKTKTVLQQYKHQALHAKSLHFTHPITDEALSLSAPAPDCFKALIQALHDDKLAHPAS